MDDRDPLTGLARTGTFQRELDARRERAKSDDSVTFTIALVDIGDLSKYDRQLGSETHNDLLCQISRRLKSSGLAQVVARVGEGRFAVLVDHVGFETASR